MSLQSESWKGITDHDLRLISDAIADVIEADGATSQDGTFYKEATMDHFRDLAERIDAECTERGI